MLEMFIFSPLLPNDKPISHVALLFQFETKEDKINVNKIDLVENYPEKTENSYTENFLEIQLLDTEGKLIVKIQKPTTRLALLDFDNPDQATAPIEEKINEFISLLPYQPNADTLIVKDDNGNNLLTLKLKDYNFSKIDLHQKLCGNGICDISENYLSCRKDCSFQLKEFINRIVP
jgi:hypothetical protein